MNDKLFKSAFEFMLGNEGSYSNDPNDRGGQTIYGITVFYHPIWFYRVYKFYRKNLLVKAIEIAKEFYYKKFWNKLYEEIIHPKLAIRLFDVSVNIGKKRAIKILQRIVNVREDGIFGTITLHAVNCYPFSLYSEFIMALAKYYESRRGFKKFGKGWMTRLYKTITNYEL